MIYNRPLKDYYVNRRRDRGNFVPFLLGRNAINYLIESLSIEAIILPSFICPMVVDVFKLHQIEIFYYEGLDKQLKAPVGDILNRLGGIKSQRKLFFLWHDYLNIVGDMPNELYDYLERNNVKPIVDATHTLPNKKYRSSIVIYGFRKLLNEPFGAFLKLNVNNANVASYSPTLMLKLWSISLIYRIKSILLFLFKFLNNNVADKLLKTLSNIDQSLNFDSNNIFLHDNFQRHKIMGKDRKLDYEKICNKRRRNFLRYAEQFPAALNFETFDVFCPFGFPLLTNNNKLIRKKLWDQGIHSFILWDSLHVDALAKNDKYSKYLSDSIVVLPVNHDLSIKDINRVIKVINE